jgi:hypothetical protein
MYTPTLSPFAEASGDMPSPLLLRGRELMWSKFCNVGEVKDKIYPNPPL